MESRLTRLHLGGFRSIADSAVDFGDLNVLIGPNGSGKSNLIGFLRMLGFMLGSDRGLGQFVGLSGGASALLHDGPKQTPFLSAHLTVETGRGSNDYAFRLAHAAGDRLVFLEEQCRFRARNRDSEPPWITLGSGGHHAPALSEDTARQEHGRKTVATIHALMRGLAVYQFHDTSDQARIKQLWSVSDNRYLKHDAANLAPFLLRLRENEPAVYRRIVSTIRRVAPFFDDFVLEPENDRVMLKWREQGSDEVFAAHQASDGTLRAMALITLFRQPAETMPPMIIVDEPELGLHPYAVAVVGELIRTVAQERQVLLATQSTAFLDEFAAEDVIVSERHGRESRFQRLAPDDLSEWLEAYSLGDLWTMNVLGGRPGGRAA